MDLLFGPGKLKKTLDAKKRSTLPYSEAVQPIEVTQCADGSILEPEDFIRESKEKRVEVLKAKYGEVHENEITWVLVKKQQADPVEELSS